MLRLGKMKIGFYLLTVLIMISCNQPSPDKGIKSETKKLDIKICDNLDIIGNWTMCSTFGNGNMTQFNVCPIVSFNSNGSGSVGNTSILTENFRWTYKKGKLIIHYADTTSNTTFSDSLYYANITKKDKSMDLVISQMKNDYVYYLSKQLSKD